ncbi:MAG: helix-turn-helix domain-containing protein [Anaerolineae bacterium]|nr:helix-turn-helix domain-containing protein [Anaerolineae bacterium]MBT7070528.1 helix-turn-helix domain-containing protein [Anaerolineae bacterium]
MRKHEVVLSSKEKKKLKAIVSTGQNKAAVIRRAHILLKSFEGKTDAEISALLYVSEQTIRRTRLRYVREGLQAALEDKPHPKPTPKLDEQQEAHLVAITCSTPPAGHARWTLELLQKRLVEDGIVDSIAPDTVRLLLKKTNSSLG